MTLTERRVRRRQRQFGCSDLHGMAGGDHRQWRPDFDDDGEARNSNKATNAYAGIREEEQRRTQQMELEDLDPKGSPHKEEKVIGGVVDLDLLSLFSLNLGKNHWRG